MRAQWENEKKAISEVKGTKQQIEEVKHQMEEAERNYDLEKLAQLKYGTLPELEKKLEEEKQLCPVLANDNGYQDAERECLREICPNISDEIIDKIQKFALKQAEVETARATYHEDYKVDRHDV